MTTTTRLINEQIDIVETCDQLGIELTPDGEGRMQAQCPFHDETVPSFKVYLKDNSWHAFCCGKGGGSLQLISQVNGISLDEAVSQYGTMMPLRAAREAMEKGSSKGLTLDDLKYIACRRIKRMCAKFGGSMAQAEEYYRTIENCKNSENIYYVFEKFVV